MGRENWKSEQLEERTTGRENNWREQLERTTGGENNGERTTGRENNGKSGCCSLLFSMHTNNKK